MDPHAASRSPVRTLGRYALHHEIAAGGMATVHLARLLGPVGFARTVAIKRLHQQFAKDPEFVSMFLDEARLAARVRHPNVVSTLDVVAMEAEIFLVMEYIQGESLSRLQAAMRNHGDRIPVPIAIRIVSDALAGLHAAHEATSEQREPLGIIHRDVSPHNILVGIDGIARIVDFGIAKAANRLQTTREGQIKGKLAYMPPEQIRGGEMDRRVDIYAASVVLWEALTGQRLFQGDEATIFYRVLEGNVPPPSRFVPLPPAVDDIVLRGLCPDPGIRFSTALEMADALERAIQPASARQVSSWVTQTAAETLEGRAALIAEVEQSSPSGPPASKDLRRLTRDGAPPSGPVPSSLAATRRWATGRPAKAATSWRWVFLGGAAIAGAALAVVFARPRLAAERVAEADAGAGMPAAATVISTAAPSVAPSATPPPIEPTAEPGRTATPTTYVDASPPSSASPSAKPSPPPRGRPASSPPHPAAKASQPTKESDFGF